MEENIRVFERNISLNPLLANRIELIAQPLWSSSGVLMTSSGAGPGSRTVVASSGSESGLHRSLAIDDFVKDRCLAHIDFIKMDIEGAEHEALSGARESIIAFQPDLALCVYHSVDHFWLLARYLDSLRLGYRFYLGHFTIHAEETVLFATARSKPVSIR
jgi:FkbM family methyltransferase